MPSRPTAVSEHLRPASSHASIGVYLSDLWKRRSYVSHVPLHELRSRNMNTVFGNLWHLLNPALSIAVYYLIFGVILSTTRGVDHYITFLAIGVLAFQFSVKAITTSSTVISANSGLLRSISFPRAMLPLTSNTTEALAFLPNLFIIFVVALVQGVAPSPLWLMVIPILGLQFLFNTGISLVAARLTHIFRDIQNILPFIFRLFFYGSGVLFSVQAYVEDPTLRWLFYVNPLFCILTLYRWAILGMPADLYEVASLLIWSSLAIIAGFWWFRKGEASYGN